MNTKNFLENSRYTLFLTVFALITSLAPVGTAVAQDEDYSAGVLEEIIVTATKREANMRDVPISIATLSGENLNSMFTGGEDILALSGRVQGLYA